MARSAPQGVYGIIRYHLSALFSEDIEESGTDPMDPIRRTGDLYALCLPVLALDWKRPKNDYSSITDLYDNFFV